MTQIKTIYCRLNGGLGNQLFQYAAARTWADEAAANLVFDTRTIVKRAEHNGMEDLLELNLRAIEGNADEISRIFPEVNWRISRLLRNIKTPLLDCYHETKNSDPDSFPNEKRSKLLLSGFWQSENFFVRNRHNILRDLTLRRGFSDQGQRMKDIIDAGPSVSIHVRRGDYLASEFNRRRYGVCGVDYYRSAISAIKAHSPDCKLVLFSDDVEWIKNIFGKDRDYLLVSGNGLPTTEELLLMSKCDHHIISNSTFGWWGAWLNTSATKHIIAPTPWFSDTKLSSATLIPSNWQIMQKGQV
jgi:hypothetical protein